MSSTFSGLSTALSGLQTQQKALETTGHNIANADTEGYSRQQVVQTASSPYASVGIYTGTAVGQTGTGVEVDAIERITDQFINAQINEETQDQAYWEKMLEGLSQIESIFNESTSSESGLDDALNDFYEALQDLSSDPEDTAVRKTVQERAEMVADVFSSICENLLEYQSSLNEDISTTVDEINSLSSRIAALNEEIVSVENSGQNANDLRDKRDQLLTELNSYVDVKSSEDSQGNLQITLDGNLLVSKDISYDLTVESTGQNQSEVIYSQTGKAVAVDSGSLGAILELCDETVAAYLDDINQLAESFVEEFNEVHQAGYDLNGDSGGDFFTIEDEDNPAMGISLTDAVASDISKIAAGRFSGTYSDNEDVATVDINDPTLLTDGYQIEVTEIATDEVEYTVTDAEGNILQDSSGAALTGTAQEGDTIDLSEELGIQLNINGIGEANISFTASVGNGNNALALSNIINNSSLTDTYQSIITSIGVAGEEAESMLENQEALLEQLEEQQASVSGVSLDEELTNLIKFQQAYKACSTVVTTINEMLDYLIYIVE
ncbi:MAG: flagellar hook-associated protein FlgK [Firmicutes bacterium]|nr:flagellar hook-associated protein FlgK [Bacillota bacterium]